MRNESTSVELDSAWILTSTFVIFLMQSGFALLESGSCTAKNHVNLMMKNVLDVIIGSIMYWSIGYGLQFGNSKWSNPFCGVGDFFLHKTNYKLFMHFVFQLSFASTANTIVSGAVAERCNFYAYCLFCSIFCLIYCIPSGWMWRENGFLNALGAIDYCGATSVHFVGGIASLVAAYKLKPRLNRYANGWRTPAPKPENAVNSISGLMFLWWGFFVFNSGSSYGITNGSWEIAARAFIVTLIASVFGGFTSFIYSQFTVNYVEVSLVINGILSACVSVCGCAGFIETYDAVYIGVGGSLITSLLPKILDRFEIDDPIGAIAVHAGGGLWGTLVVGLSASFDDNVVKHFKYNEHQRGLFKSGNFNQFGLQVLAAAVICVWTAITVWIVLSVINLFLKLRMSTEEETVGGDMWVHGIIANEYLNQLKNCEVMLDEEKIAQRLRNVCCQMSIENYTKAIANLKRYNIDEIEMENNPPKSRV
ncbi:putative ammonium transporter 3-like protein [Dinothrombium tinctorium]|uniref:Ammonium transporter n=1 Tax=Dinothrombium tinctorium TaxID=1965070 RepID=A0A3S3PNP8_9ACAR|nr:putative ammonium transporter 3-like protein [Dinothrombium tinctorium]RWS06443.1 putative ammonium transporter 3-like protein [Dinothrombium tinctorium]RWS07965.1 putative ammonium transporter 3-like protein [Dinothrombium tinctorium]